MPAFRLAFLHSLLLVVGISTELSAQGVVKPQISEAEQLVELLETGTAPLRQLRFNSTTGEVLSKTITLKIEQTLEVGGKRAPQINIPGQKIVLEIEIKKVSPDGEIDFEFRYVDFSLINDLDKNSQSAQQLEKALKPLIGAKGFGLVTNRGLTKKADFDTSGIRDSMTKGLFDGMKDMLSQISVPLPEKAVGIGAKWKTIQDVNSNGIKLKQTSLHETTSIDENGFALKTSINQVAGPQDVKNPTLPAGATMRLESLYSSSEVTNQFAFGSFIPKESSAKVNSKSVMAIRAAGQSQMVSMDMTMEMTMKDTPKQ